MPYKSFLLAGAIIYAGLAAFAIAKQPAGPPRPAEIAQVRSDVVYQNTTRQLRSNKIPAQIFQLSNLRTLSIQGMDCDYGSSNNCWAISEIPPQIIQLQQLEQLYLPVNSLTTIPLELSDLPKLKCLDLSDNPGLATIDNVTKIQSLEQLYLSGCSLTSLPKNIGALKKLKRLGLTGNALSGTEQVRIKRALPNCKIIF